jgi:hypothetical protein
MNLMKAMEGLQDLGGNTARIEDGPIADVGMRHINTTIINEAPTCLYASSMLQQRWRARSKETGLTSLASVWRATRELPQCYVLL